MSMERWLDELPDDWPVATVKLIDALRDYIRTCEAFYFDLLREEQFTAEVFHRAMRDLDAQRNMLKDLENDGVNPSLDGLIKRDWRKESS